MDFHDNVSEKILTSKDKNFLNTERLGMFLGNQFILVKKYAWHLINRFLNKPKIFSRIRKYFLINKIEGSTTYYWFNSSDAFQRVLS